MYELDSIPHKDCEASYGPGGRSTNCAICMEVKNADESTVVHSNGVCLQSFGKPCFDDWSNSCRSQGLNVTCPNCRAVLVQVEQPEEDPLEGWEIDEGNLTFDFDFSDLDAEHAETMLIIIENLATRPPRTFQRAAV